MKKKDIKVGGDLIFGKKLFCIWRMGCDMGIR